MNMAHPDDRDDELDSSEIMDEATESDQTIEKNAKTDENSRSIRSGSNPNIVNK